jgi:hypothetical protein
MTKKNIELIKNKNDELFEKTFIIFPGIDLKYYWTVLTDNQKKKIWIYLNILYTMADMILYIKNDCTSNTVSKFHNKDNKDNKENNDNTEIEKYDKNKLNFNPYVGIGTDNTQYNIDDVFAGDYDKNIEQPAQSGIGSMMNMFGIGNMFNLDQIRNQLKDMSEEDIDKATDKINNMLENDDPQTTQLISSILQNINETLNDETNPPSLNAMDDISRIAETVTQKLKPEMENGNIDLTNLMKQTKKFTNKLGASNMFPGGFNPFNMLNNLMGSNPDEVSEEEYNKKCKKVCDEMGIKEEDLQNMTPGTMQKIFSKFTGK